MHYTYDTLALRIRPWTGPHHDGIHVRIASTGSGSPLLLDIRTTRPRRPRPSPLVVFVVRSNSGDIASKAAPLPRTGLAKAAVKYT
jgi:hypothetical protein